MAKINPKYENPIDNFIVFDLCEPISDYLYNHKITPNIITTIGFISSLLSSYFLYQYKIYIFIPLYLFAYFCDCLDGFIARKYNLETKFGDYYDHITDIFQTIIILFIFIYRYSFFNFRKTVIFTLFLMILFSITQGCQEKLMGKNTSDIIGITKKMCSKNFKRQIDFIRIFGSGTMIFYILFLAYYLWLKNHHN
jgi:phosphatidylglycerophosphate synthase